MWIVTYQAIPMKYWALRMKDDIISKMYAIIIIDSLRVKLHLKICS